MTQRWWRVRVVLEVAEEDREIPVPEERRNWREVGASTVIMNGFSWWENPQEPLFQRLGAWANSEFWQLGYEAAFKKGEK